ncbi:hypothetical protein GW766_00945 [Candidatus Parcubacteria bacterium]|nr:hypothetical protein [Candidatus Parcubacteria bacterium]
MIDFEQLGGDPLTADSYVVLFKISDTHIGVVGTKAAKQVLARNLRRLEFAIRTCELHEELKAFEVSYRKICSRTKTGITEIKFAVACEKVELVLTFLEYARQSGVFFNPIVSDMQSFTTNFSSI